MPRKPNKEFQKDGRVVSTTKKTTAKAKKPTARKAKKDIDPFEIPTFLNRWIGTGKNKIEVVGYERDEKNKLFKVDKDGNKYDAESDKKVVGRKKAKD